MPEVNVDDSNFESYKQCEIRRPSPAYVLRGPLAVGDQIFDELHIPDGYYFDIVWINADIAKRNNLLEDEDGDRWTIHEVYGSKLMPAPRKKFKGTLYD